LLKEKEKRVPGNPTPGKPMRSQSKGRGKKLQKWGKGVRLPFKKVFPGLKNKVSQTEKGGPPQSPEKVLPEPPCLEKLGDKSK